MESTRSLGEISDQQLKALYTTLWNWNSCSGCLNSTTCESLSCPTRGVDRLGPFKSFYSEATGRYLPEFSSTEVALRSHEDLINIIAYIKKNPRVPRCELMRTYFAGRAKQEGHQRTPYQQDQERSFNIAARIMTMVNCSAENQVGAILEEGTSPIPWATSDSLNQFINKVFPKTDHPDLNDPGQGHKSNSLKASLQAQRLKKIAGLTFRGTDNLANHLHMDVDKGYVEIFHHTRFLKEYLISTQSSEVRLSDQTYLPRQLALEVIATIQTILFPLETPSESLLRTLVVRDNFDPDCLRLADPAFFSPPRAEGTTEATDLGPTLSEHEDTITYRYFGSRLMDLAQELEHPTPRGLLDKWLERKSGARYVMLATLAGVAAAVLLGFLSSGVSIFQAWVGWEAWRNPRV